MGTRSHSNQDTEYSAVVLTDWGADNSRIAPNVHQLIYELMLLSLLYDEILIQDEVFASSTWFAEKFWSPRDFELLHLCLRLGCIKVLTLPINTYPTDRLSELAGHSPIRARAEYMKAYSSAGDQTFIPSPELTAFHGHLDTHILQCNGTRRPVDEIRVVDFRTLFPGFLRTALLDQRWELWRKSAFPAMSPQMIEKVLRGIDHPVRAAEELPPEDRRSHPADTEFSRSLAFRIAKQFGAESSAMQNLVQTCFAAPFAASLSAVGRYGPALRELIWPWGDREDENASEDRTVSLDAAVTIPIDLPLINNSMVDIIRSVRESKEGLELRRAVQSLGSDATFDRQEVAWKAVADKLSHKIQEGRRFQVRVSKSSHGPDIVVGTVVGGLCAQGVTLDALSQLPTALAQTLLAGCVGVAGRHIYANICDDLQQQHIRALLEQAVQFRCTPIEVAAPT